MFDNLLALDGVVYLVYGNFKWSEVGFIPVDLGEVPRRFVDSSDCLTGNLLKGIRLHLLFLQFAPSLEGVVGRTLDNILNLDVLLGTSKNVSHVGDLILHKMFVGVGDLHPTDEHGGSYVIVPVIYESHLALKITDILFETLPNFHLDGKEETDVLSQLLSGSVLVIESLLHHPEITKRFSWEQI